MSDEINIYAAEAHPTVTYMVENVVGCKWSLTVIGLIQRGICRPGEMEHATEGLSAKVLNERLRKLVRFGILEKHSYTEVPPRVEYTLTEFGIRFTHILDAINELDHSTQPARPFKS